ncbi:hypothetical protein BD414DRAFT_259276 [Trametes punicea]|nr:hypothetical protein BD414DRAFT_259276 [Trametes punicea]
MNGDLVKVNAWFPGSTFALLSQFGPERYGGKGNLRLKAEEEAKRTGKSYRDVVVEMVNVPKGEVLCTPGLPPMYDHEHHPQDFPVPDEITVRVFPRLYETLEMCGGTILLTPESYEPEAVAAAKAWFADLGRAAYACGPLVATGSQATANEKTQSKQASEIEEFLDVTLRTSGERSMLYISFGSVFWPVKTPEKLWAFLDVVMELNIPFMLSCASPFAVIPDEMKEKVKAYGKGLLPQWSPQQMILEHPATGWILAHGGHNGVTEAICAGVPLIVWPFDADQPLNAVHISDNLQIGYELIEVRSGPGLQPIYRNGRKPVGTVDAVKAGTSSPRRLVKTEPRSARGCGRCRSQ